MDRYSVSYEFHGLHPDRELTFPDLATAVRTYRAASAHPACLWADVYDTEAGERLYEHVGY